MKGSRHGQHEFVYWHLERNAIITDAVIAAPHGTERRGQRTSAGVFECFTRRQQGLLAHDAKAANLLNLLIRISDDPVTADDLGGVFAIIGNTHGVREHEMPVVGFRLLGEVLWRHTYTDVIGLHMLFRFTLFVSYRLPNRCQTAIMAVNAFCR